MSKVTWNPNDKGSRIVLSNNNLTCFGIDAVRATKPIKLGEKVYFEFIKKTNNTQYFLGISSKSYDLTGGNSSEGTKAGIVAMLYDSNMDVYKNVAPTGRISAGLSSLSLNDVLGIAVDRVNHTIRFYRNGTQGTSISISSADEDFFPTFSTAVNSTYLEADALFHKSSITIKDSNTSEWNQLISDGFVAYDDKTEYNFIKSSNKIQVLDGTSGTWTDTLLTEPLTKTNFETHGMDDISTITNAQWEALEGADFEVITWTDEEGAEQQAQLQSVEDNTWSDEGKLFEIVIGENEKIKNITALNVE